MRFLIENLWMGLKNLRLHKLRTLLTALGIIIGVAAVIVMVAIGEGAKREAMAQMEHLGANNILIRSIPPMEGSDNSSRTTRILEYGLTDVDLQRVQMLPGLTLVVPLRETEQRVSFDGLRFGQISAIASTPQIFEVINLKASEGRLFSQEEYDRNEAVCVLGSEAARLMFPSENPIGHQVLVGTPTLGTITVTVIGVLDPTGLRANADQAKIVQRDIDRDLYFPLTLSRNVFGSAVVKRKAGSIERKNVAISEIWAQAGLLSQVENLAAVSSNVIGLPARQDAQVKAPIEILRAAEKTQRTFNAIMVSVAGFSLVVGGIGIMNIMLATVTERTREIGIRRALGAKRKHITLQFLIETTAISLTGGLLGVITGAVFATALPPIVAALGSGGYPTSIAPWSVVGSFFVSGAIGIGFGLYPAIMAARMNPIEALRHE